MPRARTDFGALYNFIQRGQSEGLSGNAILRTFREQGFAIRTQTFFQLHRTFLDYKGVQDRAGGLDKRFVPTGRDIAGLPFQTRTTFVQQGIVRGTDRVTGLPVERVISVGVNRPHAPAWVEAEIADTLDSDKDRYGIDVAGVEYRGTFFGWAGR